MNTATVEVTTPGDREIAMTRVVDAPRRLVFDALTQPELVRRWLLGPPGWSMPVCEIDLRVGGAYRYVWKGPGGAGMEAAGVYREIAPPERCVVTERFVPPWYSGEAVVTTELRERDGKTTMTTTVRYESVGVRDAVLKSDMAKGVAMSDARLEELLRSGAAAEA